MQLAWDRPTSDGLLFIWFIMVYHGLSMFIMFHHRIFLVTWQFTPWSNQTKSGRVYSSPRLPPLSGFAKKDFVALAPRKLLRQELPLGATASDLVRFGYHQIVINFSINWIGPPLFINWNKLGGLLDPCWIFICMSSPVSKHPKMIQCVATDQKTKKGSGF